MNTRAAFRDLVVLFGALSSIVVLTSTLAACNSKEGEQRDAQAKAPPGNGTGPLAALESSPFLNEVWTSEEGQQVPLLYYTRENVRLSTPCRNNADGTLACDAIRYLRNGMPAEIPRRSLDGRTSAGVKVCQKLGNGLVTVRNSVGSEDSLCRFPDGSFVSTGTLEQYGMRVLQ
ncbi:hypothetical protein AKJ09_03584 [Labilithrix luteola]|uniref:Lipoprotein n=1 Tax=Labilithrix luteola TaxID=1391654 RepID=A0A0K1PTR0_9BACT|nr:hypothetical protein [Labilithrix luteola]AKU96920.1 hypothetical protein AKJ09_03584 [Labilithrix luteola]